MGSHAFHKINIHRNHHNKMLYPLVEINNHLVKGLVDIGASMFVMFAEIILA
jgi:predicted aspartyl protease